MCFVRHIRLPVPRACSSWFCCVVRLLLYKGREWNKSQAHQSSQKNGRGVGLLLSSAHRDSLVVGCALRSFRSLYLLTNETNGMQFAGECPGGSACQWYTQKTTTPGEVTNCDAAMRTMGVNCGDENPTDFPCTAGAAVPWCAPGSAQVASPCGIYSGTSGGTRGRDMRDLPAGPADEWVAGGVAEVAWAITANHGGGYAYRLCPAGESDLSEACFQQNHLAFAGDSSSIVDPEGNVVAKAPAVRTIAGTVPAGSGEPPTL